MMKVFGILGTLLLLLLLIWPTQAQNIHLRQNEAWDSQIGANGFETFSFTGEAGEAITLVVYGLEASAIPDLTVLDPSGLPIVENFNDPFSPVISEQFTLSANGIYTFIVGNISGEAGVMRTLLTKGDPLISPSSHMDIMDPVLPARAYLVRGEPADDINMQIAVLDDDDETTPLDEIFASRGSSIVPPPNDERTSPILIFSWQNEAGENFYTVTSHTTPEPYTAADVEAFALTNDTLPISFITLFLGDEAPSANRARFGLASRPQQTANETTPQLIPRNYEPVVVFNGATQSFVGPGEDFPAGTTFPANTLAEIAGENSDYYLVVDPNAENSQAWVLKSAVNVQPNPVQMSTISTENLAYLSVGTQYLTSVLTSDELIAGVGRDAIVQSLTSGEVVGAMADNGTLGTVVSGAVVESLGRNRITESLVESDDPTVGQAIAKTPAISSAKKRLTR